MPLSRLHVLLALPCALLSTGCGPSPDRPVVVIPKPSAALLLPCQDPPAADTATDTGVALVIIGLGQAFADCRQRQADLAKWVKETSAP